MKTKAENMGKFICSICGKELPSATTCDSMSSCVYVGYTNVSNSEIRRQLGGGNVENDIGR